MARGMAAGEPIVSQAGTTEYREGHDRTFNRPRISARGRWIWDESAGKLVRAEDYVPPTIARSAPIMCDRFMEGDRATDGTDIGSRSKRRRYMAENDLVDYSDGKGARERRAKEQAARARGERPKDPALRHFIGQQLYQQKVII